MTTANGCRANPERMLFAECLRTKSYRTMSKKNRCHELLNIAGQMKADSNIAKHLLATQQDILHGLPDAVRVQTLMIPGGPLFIRQELVDAFLLKPALAKIERDNAVVKFASPWRHYVGQERTFLKNGPGALSQTGQ